MLKVMQLHRNNYQNHNKIKMMQMDSVKDNQNSDSSNSNAQPFSSNNQIEQPLVPQEQINPGNNPGDIASSWHILSIFSWVFLICTIMNMIFGRSNFRYQIESILYIDSHFISFYMLIISILGFSVLIKRTVYDQDVNFMSGIFGDQSKFHAIGLVMAAAVFMCLHLGLESEPDSGLAFMGSSSSSSSTTRKYLIPLYSITLSFSTIGVLVLLYAYSKIETQYQWYEVLSIKKGTFSSLIAFLWYTLFYSASRIGLYRKRTSFNSSIDALDDMKGMSIAFTIIIGVFNLSFSVYKKDLGPAAVNLIIFISNAIYVFSPSFAPINDEFENVMTMIMVFFSFVTFTYLLMNQLDSVMKV